MNNRIENIDQKIFVKSCDYFNDGHVVADHVIVYKNVGFTLHNDDTTFDCDKVHWITSKDNDSHTDLYHDFIKEASRVDLDDELVLRYAYICHDVARQKRDRAMYLKDCAWRDLKFWRQRQSRDIESWEAKAFGMFDADEVRINVKKFQGELEATELFLRKCLNDIFWIEYFLKYKDC